MKDFTEIQLYKIAPEISVLQTSNVKLTKRNKGLMYSLVGICIVGVIAVKTQKKYYSKDFKLKSK